MAKAKKYRYRKCWLCAMAKKENHKLKRESYALRHGEQPYG